MRSLAARTTGIRVVEDTPTALRITHIGNVKPTSVVVTTATNIVLTDATAASTFTFGSGNGTLGALVDNINATARWRAKILDGLRSTLTTASNLVAGSLTINGTHGEMGWDVKLDTTTTFTFAVRATYDRSAGNLRQIGGHRVKVNHFEYVLNVGTAAADKVRIYEWDPVLKTESQIFSAASTQNTSTVTTHDLSKAPVTAKEGNDLIVLVTDAASISDAATNYLQVLYTLE